MDNLSKFSERLDELIFDAGLTNKQFSKALGISTSTVSCWKNAKHKLSLSHALMIADYFGCSLEFLAGRAGEKLDYTPHPYPPFYERLLQIMKIHGKSRYRMVRETKFSDGNFYSWKKGGEPYLQSVIELADYFKLTLDAFIGRETYLTKPLN